MDGFSVLPLNLIFSLLASLWHLGWRGGMPQILLATGVRTVKDGSPTGGHTDHENLVTLPGDSMYATHMQMLTLYPTDHDLLGEFLNMPTH